MTQWDVFSKILKVIDSLDTEGFYINIETMTVAEN
jgi:hypothetical protein